MTHTIEIYSCISAHAVFSLVLFLISAVIPVLFSAINWIMLRFQLKCRVQGKWSEDDDPGWGVEVSEHYGFEVCNRVLTSLNICIASHI